MAASYPGNIYAPGANPSSTSPRNNPSLAGEISGLNGEVVAIETALGTNLSNVTGSGTFPTFKGVGSPEGSKSASVGQTYYDGTNAALYFKIFGSGNTGWALGGYSTDDTSGNGIIGYGIQGAGALELICGVVGEFSGNILLTDIVSAGGLENGLQFVAGAVDGQQYLTFRTGSSGQYIWQFNVDGSFQIPGQIRVTSASVVAAEIGGAIATAPPSSHTATAAFGSASVGSAIQNNLGYDVTVNVAIPVSVSAGGSINVGVGSTSTPTVDPISPALSAATIINWSGVVPSGYYLKFTTTGSITTGTPVTQVTPL